MQVPFEPIDLDAAGNQVTPKIPNHLRGGGLGYLDCMDRALIHRGPLHIGGDWRLDRSYRGCALIVDGDLTISGVYMDVASPPNLSLIVLGSMKVDSMAVGDFLTVTGDLEVNRTIYGASGDDCTYEVGGNLRCELLFLHGHAGNPDPEQGSDRLFAQCTCRYGGHYEVAGYTLQGKMLKEALTEEALTALQDSTSVTIRELAISGRPLLKPV
jgi:hypothetical protein